MDTPKYEAGVEWFAGASHHSVRLGADPAFARRVAEAQAKTLLSLLAAGLAWVYQPSHNVVRMAATTEERRSAHNTLLADEPAVGHLNPPAPRRTPQITESRFVVLMWCDFDGDLRDHLDSRLPDRAPLEILVSHARPAVDIEEARRDRRRAACHIARRRGFVVTP